MAVKRSLRRTQDRPGTVIDGGQGIIDAKGRRRTLPSSKTRREKFIAGVKRKLEAKAEADTTSKIVLPKTLPKTNLLRILRRMGFVEVPGAAPRKFRHPHYGVVHLPSGRGVRTGAINIRRSFWRGIIRDYLKKGGEI